MGCRRGWSHGRPARVDLARLVSRVAKGVDLWERCGTSGRGLDRGDSRAQRGTAPGERAGRFGRARPPSPNPCGGRPQHGRHRILGRLSSVGQRGTSASSPPRNRQKIGLAHGMAAAEHTWVVTLDRTFGSNLVGTGLARPPESSIKHSLRGRSRGAELVAAIALLWEGVQALDYAAQMGWSAGCLVATFRDPPPAPTWPCGMTPTPTPETSAPRGRHLGRPGASARRTSRGMACGFARNRAHRGRHLLARVDSAAHAVGRKSRALRPKCQAHCVVDGSMAVVQWALWLGACVAPTAACGDLPGDGGRW